MSSLLKKLTARSTRNAENWVWTPSAEPLLSIGVHSRFLSDEGFFCTMASHRVEFVAAGDGAFHGVSWTVHDRSRRVCAVQRSAPGISRLGPNSRGRIRRRATGPCPRRVALTEYCRHGESLSLCQMKALGLTADHDRPLLRGEDAVELHDR